MGTKISELPSGGQINGFELLPVVQSSDTKSLDIKSINKKPIFEIDLSSGFYNINAYTEYGNYYVSVATPNKIILPPPSNLDGYEIIICNYDQDNDAEFFGDFIPYIQSSTQSGEEYLKIPKKQTVRLVSINDKWNACSFSSGGSGPTDEYIVYNATLKYDTIFGQLFENKLKDTIGDITLNYFNTGVYTIDSAGGLFSEGKTQIFIGQNNNGGAGGDGNFVFYTCNRQNSSSILLNVYDVNVGGSDVYSADLMTDLSIEIRVYP